mmetsp:Transcript_29338/g.41975  ORF Transcript_29338/g.41975 Transcript_29338/m.41975 type:complete len:98 (+) Transcript_29338:46-339(+)
MAAFFHTSNRYFIQLNTKLSQSGVNCLPIQKTESICEGAILLSVEECPFLFPLQRHGTFRILSSQIGHAASSSLRAAIIRLVAFHSLSYPPKIQQFL